jgi:chloramphenicol 3-O-phosphotransferase
VETTGERVLLESILRTVRERQELKDYLSPTLSATEAASSLQPIADAAAGVEIRWIGVNESRVDAGITSIDGREWRVVFTTNAAGRLAGLWVFQRPPPFRGWEGGRAIVVNGLSGSGKSALMQQFEESEDPPWVVFDEINLGRVRSGYLIWPEPSGPLHRGFLAGIAALAAQGNQVIMASSGLPHTLFVEALTGIPTLYVGLTCPLSVAVERNHGRQGRWGGLAENSTNAHEGWHYDLLLDSNALRPDALVAEVRKALASKTEA